MTPEPLHRASYCLARETSSEIHTNARTAATNAAGPAKPIRADIQKLCVQCAAANAARYAPSNAQSAGSSKQCPNPPRRSRLSLIVEKCSGHGRDRTVLG